MGGMKTKARVLRKNMTDAERALWRSLRLRQMQGYKFRRQQPIGPCIVDFVCFEMKLVIELDGGQHAIEAYYDASRTKWLRHQGFTVLRFWNHDVLKEGYSVKQVIWDQLTPHLNPPPQGGRK